MDTIMALVTIASVNSDLPVYDSNWVFSYTQALLSISSNSNLL